MGGRFPVFTAIIQCSCWRDSGLKEEEEEKKNTGSDQRLCYDKERNGSVTPEPAQLL